MNDAEREASEEETKEIDPNHIRMLHSIERVNGSKLEVV
jgi:hypothetical protein